MDKNIDKEINIFEYFAPNAPVDLTNFPNLANSKKVWGLGIKTADGGPVSDATTNSRNGYKSWTTPGGLFDDLKQFTQYYGYYIINNPGTSPYVLYNETSALPYKKNIKYQYQIAMFRGDGLPPSDTSTNTTPIKIDANLPFILNNKIKTIFGVSATGRAWVSWSGVGKPNSLRNLTPGESYIFVSNVTNNIVDWTLYDFPTPTATATPTPTPTPTPTISPTPGPSPTATSTPTPSPTSTDAPGPSPTATSAPVATATPTATPVSFDGILVCGDSGSAAGEQCIGCTSSGLCDITLDVVTLPKFDDPPIPAGDTYMELIATDGLGGGWQSPIPATSAIVNWNGSPSVLNDAKLQGKVTVTYYGTDDNFNLGPSKVVQSTPVGFDWNTAPSACGGGLSGIVCTVIDSNMLLSNFGITGVKGTIYYFLVEIDIEDCAGYKAISNRRIGDFLSACGGDDHTYQVDYNADGEYDACQDCVCRPGVYNLGCPQSFSDGSHPAGRRPCGMFIVHY
jgi:hypothetical protein